MESLKTWCSAAIQWRNMSSRRHTSEASSAATPIVLRMAASNSMGIPITFPRMTATTLCTAAPFDFRKPHAIGERINADDAQLRLGHGYDHNFVLDHPEGRLSEAAEAYEPTSGRILRVLTTEPGVQLYTGNFLDGSITGKEGRVYKARYAVW